MNVAFYTFSKRKNSTKQPTGTGTVKDCKLKDNCSVHNPVLICASNAMGYNYAHITTWGKYYFVTDTVYLANNLVEYHLSEDVLASYKSDIESTKAYVAYCSTHYHSRIIDPRIITYVDKEIHKLTGDVVGSGLGYLLTVFNDGNHMSYGMGTQYYLTESQLWQFRYHMATDTDLMDEIAQYMNGKSMDAIFSLRCVPYTVTADNSIRVSVSSIGIGNKSVNVSAIRLNTICFNGGTSKFTPHYRYNDFRMSDPYTKGWLYLPGAGCNPVNVSDFVDSDYIYVAWSLCENTGDYYYEVRDSQNNISFTTCVNMSTECPIGQTVLNASGTVGSIGGIIGGMAGTLIGGAALGPSGAIAGAAATLTSAANLALASNQKTTSTAGNVGAGFYIGDMHIRYAEYALDTADPTTNDYIDLQGRPYGEYLQLGLATGYIECVNAHVAAAASEQELTEIESYLNSGFYHE